MIAVMGLVCYVLVVHMHHCRKLRHFYRESRHVARQASFRHIANTLSIIIYCNGHIHVVNSSVYRYK